MISSSNSVDLKIFELRKKNFGLFRIHKWLIGWDNYSQLDEIVCLCHILNVLDRNNVAVSRSEVRYCFNKFYNPKFHADKKGYLAWIYKEFCIKLKTKVNTSQVRPQIVKKTASSCISDHKRGISTHENSLIDAEQGYHTQTSLNEPQITSGSPIQTKLFVGVKE